MSENNSKGIEMLPLPEPKGDVAGGGLDWTDEEMQDHARAVAEHNVKKRDAEIEALRAEREVIGAEAVKYADKSGRLEAKVERLVETLRLARDLVEDWAGYAGEYFQKKHNLEGDLALLDAALLDHDKEARNG